MALPYYVNLPRSQLARWPYSCVRCGKPKPGGVYRFALDKKRDMYVVTFGIARASRPRIYARTCHSCAASLRSQRFWRAIASWLNGAVALGVAALAFHHSQGWHWLFRGKLSAILAAGVCVVPIALYVRIKPLAVNAVEDEENDIIRYEFEHDEYATIFAVVNHQLPIDQVEGLLRMPDVAPLVPEEQEQQEELLRSKRGL